MKPVRKFVGRKVSGDVNRVSREPRLWSLYINTLSEARIVRICVYKTGRLAVTNM